MPFILCQGIKSRTATSFSLVLTVTSTLNIVSLIQTRALKARVASARPRLYRLAYAWTHDAYLADDLTQETMTKSLKSGYQLKDDAALDPWLFSILHNCLRDHFRKLHPHADLEEIMELPSPDPSPEQFHAQTELVGRVRRAVAALPLGQRQVVTLVDLEEMSYSAAALALNIPIGTVMSRLNRARLALRGLLQESTVPLHVITSKARSEQ